MSLLFVEGFDDNLAAARNPNYAGAIDAAYGYTGKGMLVGDNYADGYLVPVSTKTSDDTITFGARINIRDTGSTSLGATNLCGFTSGADLTATYECVVAMNPATKAWAVRDQSGITNGVGGSCQLNTWYYVELECTKGNLATGAWELRVDGVTVLSATSRDTYRAATTSVMIGGYGAYDVDALWVDDVYIIDSLTSYANDFLGISAVLAPLLPSGNGNSSLLVGSDGNSTDNYLLVDNNASAPPATTEYVESDTEGDKDTYAMDDVSGTPTVHGIMTSLYAQKDDSGAKFVRPVIRSGGTDYPGTSFALSDSVYVVNDECWDTDPDTGIAWLYGGVNGMQVGPEVRDS